MLSGDFLKLEPPDSYTSATLNNNEILTKLDMTRIYEIVQNVSNFRAF